MGIRSKETRAGGSVFLVDPDEKNRAQLEAILRESGWQITVSDGSVPLPQEAPEPPCVFLVAGHRKGFDQLALIRELRDNPATACSPVVLLAGHDLQTLAIAALKEGADDVAAEPFTRERLFARVQAHLLLAHLRKEGGEATPRAFDQLRLSERRFRSLVEATATVVWITSREGLVLERMPMWESFTGQGFEDYRDYGWISAFHPDERERLKEIWNHAVEKQSPVTGDFIIRNQAGEHRQVQLEAVPSLERQDEIREWVAMIQDVTETRKAEEALRENEQRLRLIMESSTDFAIFTTDLDGVITSWNSGARNLLGYDEEEILGTNFECIFTEDDLKNNIPEQELQAARRNGRGADQRWHVRKNETLFWADGLVMPLRDKDGGICGFLKIVRDFTAQKKTMDALQVLTAELEQRVKKRTHQLEHSRNRLRSLVFALNNSEQMERQRIAAELHDGLAQLLTAAQLTLKAVSREIGVDDREGSKSLKQVQEIIGEATRTTRGLMTELSGPRVLEHDDLVVTLRWMIEKMSNDDFSVSLTHNQNQVPLERDLLMLAYQSVRELLLNVAKHAQVNEASVHITRSSNRLVVEVRDKGRGFSPNTIHHDANPMSGFGLLNIQERVQWVGGDLEIESAPNHGTVARIVLPLTSPANRGAPAAEQQPLTEGAPPVPKDPASRPITVLLVEDHRMVREGFRSVIEETPDIVVIGEAADGVEALENAQKLIPDVVVMDINMPRMNGIEATRQLRAKLPHVTVIGLSIHGEKDVAEAMKEAGAAAYVSKDEAFETLCGIIRAQFGR